jgi:DNA processing protein
MDDKDLIDRLRLIRTSHIGPVTCQLLLRRYNTPKAALQAIPELSARGGRRLKACTIEVAEKELSQIRKSGAKLICHGQEHYPASLYPYDDAPFILTAKGHTSLLNRASCAIVGARNASINATHLAKKLAGEIGQQGFIVTSGLARGIDAAAHHGALASGTIAVLANGIDEIYPPENAGLYKEIAERGLLITEMRYGTKPSSRLFPSRNRIIASLSKAVLVIEAALRSGSLITAREAADRGIEVMALPGSPLDPRSQGTNGLIRDGATLVQNVDDILNVLSQTDRMETPPPEPYQIPSLEVVEISEKERTEIHEKLLENIAHDPIAVDELCRWCHVSADIVQSFLLELELAVQIQRYSKSRVSRLIPRD